MNLSAGALLSQGFGGLCGVRKTKRQCEVRCAKKHKTSNSSVCPMRKAVARTSHGVGWGRRVALLTGVVGA